MEKENVQKDSWVSCLVAWRHYRWNREVGVGVSSVGRGQLGGFLGEGHCVVQLPRLPSYLI